MQMYKNENAPSEFISTICLLCRVLSAHIILLQRSGLLNQPIKLLDTAVVRGGLRKTPPDFFDIEKRE
jgi:hypothetical protein